MRAEGMIWLSNMIDKARGVDGGESSLFQEKNSSI